MGRELVDNPKSLGRWGIPCWAVGEVETAKSFPEAKSNYFKPAVQTCPHCESRLRRDHAVWRKFVTTLVETRWVVNVGYKCPNQSCPKPGVVYRSAAADALSLRSFSYGMDVVAQVGYLRFHEHLTRKEIHEWLRERNVPISEREVQHLYEVYSLLLSCSVSERIAERRAQMVANGGIIVSLDGVQPEKGNETLWVVREVLTGTTLAAKNLTTSDTASLKDLLQPIAELGLPILGVVSDAQKAIRLAVEALFPGVPYQLCHFHFMKDIALPTIK